MLKMTVGRKQNLFIEHQNIEQSPGSVCQLSEIEWGQLDHIFSLGGTEIYLLLVLIPRRPKLEQTVEVAEGLAGLVTTGEVGVVLPPLVLVLLPPAPGLLLVHLDHVVLLHLQRFRSFVIVDTT